MSRVYSLFNWVFLLLSIYNLNHVMEELLAQVNNYLDYVFDYSWFWVYTLIFFVCFVENIIPPIPGDAFMVAGGVLVALGKLNIFLLLLVIIAGGLTSVMLLYWLGKKYGRDYFIRKNFKYFRGQDIMKLEVRLQKHGPWLLTASRFFVSMRTVLALSIGIGRYPAKKTFIFSLLSYLIFSSILVFSAMTLVENLEYLKSFYYLIWAIVAAMIIVFLIRKKIIFKSKNDTAKN